MATVTLQNARKVGRPSPVLPRLFRLAIVVAMDSLVVWFLLKLAALGYYPFAAAIGIIAIFVNVVLLRKETYPIRWMVVGLVLMALFVIYPIIFTVWVAFTNYGEGHLITKEQAIDQLSRQTYLPPEGKLRGPLVRIMIWNFIFPTLSVLSTFALGLMIALLFNDPKFPFKRTIRSLLLIPYTIPALITIIIWRGMMNPEFGVINRMLMSLFDVSVPWTTHQTWAKVAVLLVNLWLGYPYFMLICSGALQAIPSDLYEAANVDGASIWVQFRRITLPLLLVAVGPLLIASYIYNFNNFNLIYLFIEGGPPIAGATTRAGHTDILISYVYQLAFSGGGRGVQYGLASAITIVIFMIVGVITLLQFRFTNMWEEVSENV
jgi:ABC-type sugar transport system permease subunit